MSPYLLIELLLPGGSVIALLLWIFRRRARASNVTGTVSVVTAAAWRGNTADARPRQSGGVVQLNQTTKGNRP